MFDDDQIQQPGQAPVNLPVGEPEDIFDKVEKPEVNPVPSMENTPVSQPVTASALDAGILKPKDNKNNFVANLTENADSLKDESVIPDSEVELKNAKIFDEQKYNVKGPYITRILVTVVIVVVGLAFLFGGGLLLYNKFFKNNPNDNSGLPDGQVKNEQSSMASVEENNNTLIEESKKESLQETVDNNILFGETKDTDADGLDDLKEIEWKTDPKNWDSDQDGLSDGEEILIWKTDALNPDTDKDGYKDGTEIKSGYSPLGSGKLLEVNDSFGDVSSNSQTVAPNATNTNK